MSTLRATLGKFAMPLVGVTFIVLGILAVRGGDTLSIIVGVLEIITGICCLCAS